MPIDPGNLPDPPDPPNQTGSANRRLTAIGVILWIIVIGSVAVFLFTDVGGDGVESALASVVGIGGAAIVALLVGAIVYQILKRLNLIGSLFMNLIWGILLSIALPVVGWFAVQELGIVNNAVQTDILDALPINQEARGAITQLQEIIE